MTPTNKLEQNLMSYIWGVIWRRVVRALDKDKRKEWNAQAMYISKQITASRQQSLSKEPIECSSEFASWGIEVYTPSEPWSN